MASALEKVDNTLAELMESLYDKNLHNCVNLVIIADHGIIYLFIYLFVLYTPPY